MRRIVNSTYMTLDGAVENPHLWPSLGTQGSELSVGIQNKLLQECDAVLMGRKTYEAFAAVWPTRSGDSMSDRINSRRKYEVSSTLKSASWENTKVIGGDVVTEIAEMKRQPGKDIVQYGLGPVSFLLMENGLIDEFRLWVHPLILGRMGPKSPHFLDCAPARFELTGSRSLPNGIVILNYAVSTVPKDRVAA